MAANSNEQPVSVVENKPEPQPMKDTPPWITATGDIDERKSRNPYQNTASSQPANIMATSQAQAPLPTPHLKQAPWLAKSQESEVSSVPTNQTVTQPGLPPWARQQLQTQTSQQAKFPQQSEGAAPWARQQPRAQTSQQTKFPQQSERAGATEGSNQAAAVGRPPWARTPQQQGSQVLFQSETSQVIGSPPWSKSQGQTSQTPTKKNEAPWKSSTSDKTRSDKSAETSIAPPWATHQAKAQATVPPWGKSDSEAKLDTKMAARSAPWAKKASAADKSPPKTPWEAKRQSELSSKAGGSTSNKKAKYDPFEREYKSSKSSGEDVIDKRLAEINKKMAAMDRKIKEYEEKEHRRKGGRSRSRSRDRDRRRSRSRERDRSRRDRSRERDEGRYRERGRGKDRSPRSSRRSPPTSRRDSPETKVPDESR